MELIKENQYDPIHHTQCLYIGWGKRSIWKLLEKSGKSQEILESKISRHPVHACNDKRYIIVLKWVQANGVWFRNIIFWVTKSTTMQFCNSLNILVIWT